jgi:hypothetical protein
MIDIMDIKRISDEVESIIIQPTESPEFLRTGLKFIKKELDMLIAREIHSDPGR